jgi:hypothetical protein
MLCIDPVPEALRLPPAPAAPDVDADPAGAAPRPPEPVRVVPRRAREPAPGWWLPRRRRLVFPA